MDAINWILTGGFIGLTGTAVKILLSGPSEKEKEKEKEKSGEARKGDSTNVKIEGDIPLEKLAEKLWLRAQETGEIRIEELSQLWVEKKEPEIREEKEYSFKNEKIREFCRTYIDDSSWLKDAPVQKSVCYQILLLLEKEGDCPSVVNVADDVESSWNENTYNRLAKTSLLDHSLHVGEEAVALLRAKDALYVVPNTMVAALGHDIGKLPSNRDELYNTGDHPLSAGYVLSSLEGFEELKRKDEILRAIKLHHKSPEGLLGETLKAADQKARQKELEWAGREEKKAKPDGETEKQPDQLVTDSVPDTSQEKENVQDREETRQPKQSVNTAPPAASGSAWKAQTDIYGENESEPQKAGRSDAPGKINISSWFRPDDFLAEMKPYINRVQGRSFKAFSMPDGYVYFQVKVLEMLARQQANEAGAIDVDMADKKTMQSILLSIVDHFRERQDVIARELIQDQYFGGYFTIVKKGGSPLTGYYTPFHADVFGSVAEMETKKKGTILEYFKKIHIQGQENEEG